MDMYKIFHLSHSEYTIKVIKSLGAYLKNLHSTKLENMELVGEFLDTHGPAKLNLI